MPLIDGFVHNGATVNRTLAPPPTGPLGRHIFGIVGTAPDADPSLPRSKPILIKNLRQASKLDTTGNEAGTLWRTVTETFRLITVPFYVVIEEEGATLAETEANIIGGVDPDTGRLTGIAALSASRQAPTHICAPGFSSKPVADALAAMGKRLYAIPVGDGPGTTDTAAVDFSALLGGEGTGYDAYYLVDPQVIVFSRAAQGNVTFSGAAIALSNFGRVARWESPEVSGGALIQGVSRNIDYNILDRDTQGDLLNRNGISYFANDGDGFSLIGNRSVTGRFINQVGLEHAIVTHLARVAKGSKGKNLTGSLIDQEISKLNVWGAQLASNETLIGLEVYLHPTLNSVDNYRNGEWHIAIKYAGYSPNEHMVYHVIEDTGIVESFLEELL